MFTKIVQLAKHLCFLPNARAAAASALVVVDGGAVRQAQLLAVRQRLLGADARAAATLAVLQNLLPT